MMAPPTWAELDAMAAARGLQILRRPLSLSIYTQAPLIISRMLDLSIGDLDRDPADQLMRALTNTALQTLKPGP